MSQPTFGKRQRVEQSSVNIREGSHSVECNLMGLMYDIRGSNQL